MPEEASGPTVRPPGAATGADPEIVTRLLVAESPTDVLTALLSCPADDVVRAAVVALGVRGVPAHTTVLRRLLQGPERRLAELAEDSMWRIWLRAGSDRANTDLAQAIELIGADHLLEALTILNALVAAEPGFAEPHNQRGIVLCLLDQPAEAVASFERAIQLNPDHFPALVSMGHASVQQGHFRTAIRCYQRALEINPGLDTVREIVDRLERVGGGSGKLAG